MNIELAYGKPGKALYKRVIIRPWRIPHFTLPAGLDGQKICERKVYATKSPRMFSLVEIQRL